MMDLDDVSKRLLYETYPYIFTLNLGNLGEPCQNQRAFEMIRCAQEHSVREKVSSDGWVLFGLWTTAISLDC